MPVVAFITLFHGNSAVRRRDAMLIVHCQAKVMFKRLVHLFSLAVGLAVGLGVERRWKS
jgi:hypothetical protein